MASQTTVVTGGAGYIGAALCRELLATGRSVRALDNLLHGQDEIAAALQADGVEVVRGDLRDAAVRERVISGADEVVHLAAIVGDPACALDPAESNEVNVEGSRQVVSDAQRLGVGKLVF